jgi:hypothetical protein
MFISRFLISQRARLESKVNFFNFMRRADYMIVKILTIYAKWLHKLKLKQALVLKQV